MKRVPIPTEEITDWSSFHDVFARVFGFPDFYGRNMNAWIDCMTSLDSPEDGMSTVHAEPGGVLIIDLGECTDFARRLPGIYEVLLDSSAFVNHRKMEIGGQAVLALSFWNRQPIIAPSRSPK